MKLPRIETYQSNQKSISSHISQCVALIYETTRSKVNASLTFKYIAYIPVFGRFGFLGPSTSPPSSNSFSKTSSAVKFDVRGLFEAAAITHSVNFRYVGLIELSYPNSHRDWVNFSTSCVPNLEKNGNNVSFFRFFSDRGPEAPPGRGRLEKSYR